jgi:glycosyltransferase involved in cell wall biosynthesis
VKRAVAAGDFLIIIPAFNEEGAVGGVVREIRLTLPSAPVLVIDDCSSDGTKDQAESAGADVLPLPYHLGLGGCVQAGYKLAFELGYEYVIRVDGDGQHDPRDIPRILDQLRFSGCQMVIGSRFQGQDGDYTSALRALGIRIFRLVLRPILGKPVREVFTRSFPLEYPEIETLVVLQRKRFQFQEVTCRMRPRQAGRSSITPVKSIYYFIHVLLGVFVNVLKFEGRRRRG